MKLFKNLMLLVVFGFNFGFVVAADVPLEDLKKGYVDCVEGVADCRQSHIRDLVVVITRAANAGRLKEFVETVSSEIGIGPWPIEVFVEVLLCLSREHAQQFIQAVLDLSVEKLARLERLPQNPLSNLNPDLQTRVAQSRRNRIESQQLCVQVCREILAILGTEGIIDRQAFVERIKGVLIASSIGVVVIGGIIMTKSDVTTEQARIIFQNPGVCQQMSVYNAVIRSTADNVCERALMALAMSGLFGGENLVLRLRTKVNMPNFYQTECIISSEYVANFSTEQAVCGQPERILELCYGVYDQFMDLAKGILADRIPVGLTVSLTWEIASGQTVRLHSCPEVAIN